MSCAYIIHDGEYYKIGHTYSDATTRLSNLQVGSAKPLTLVLTIPSKTPDLLEQELHQRFLEKKIRGEWFALNDADIDDLKRGDYEEFCYSGSTIGCSAFDVRPLCGRQQHPISAGRKDVSFGRSAVDHARCQPIFLAGRREHEISLPTVFWQERQEHCTGNCKLHIDRTLRDSDSSGWRTDLFYWMERPDIHPPKRCTVGKRRPKPKGSSNTQNSLEFGF